MEIIVNCISLHYIFSLDIFSVYFNFSAHCCRFRLWEFSGQGLSTLDYRLQDFLCVP